MKKGFCFLYLAILFPLVPSSSLGQWVQMTGLQGGFIHHILVHESDVFIGTNAGIFRSTNSGLSWSPANSGLNNPTITALGSNGIYIYAAVLGINYPQRCVYRSDDHGMTWETANSGLPENDDIMSFAVLGPKIFAASNL